MDLEPKLRSATTLGVLCLMMLLGLVWGVNALTKPFPALIGTPEPTGPCSPRVVAAGEQVRRAQVTVSVYNAGTTQGQASTLLEQLVLKEFAAGVTGNAPVGTRVRDGVQIWAPDAESPAVRLLVSVFGKNNVTVIDKAPLGPGVTVIVGDDLPALNKGVPQATARSNATVCSPVLP